MKKVLILICLSIFFILNGCASPEPKLAAKIEDIAGIYSVNPGNTHVRFNPDGTFYAVPSLSLAKNPVSPPESFWFEENILYLSSIDSPVCGTMTATYQVEILENGKLRFYVIEDACEHRRGVFQGMINPDSGLPNNIWSPIE